MADLRDNPIVQPWGSTDPTDGSPINRTWTYLSDKEKIAILDKATIENGITRPQGYNVSFHYNANVEYHHFGRSHPMKPWRLTLTKQLIMSFGLHNAMDLYESLPARFDELAEFHGRDYLEFIRDVRPDTLSSRPNKDVERFGFGGEYNDCPVFDGLWNYVSIYTGASMEAAHHLTNQTSDIAINWSGGLHHAKKSAASGFCYINDIVLAIQQLLKYHQRVLYIDIDVHHGDGVEQAFFSTPRVFTLSFHKFGDNFFPLTGDINETGPTYRGNPGTAHALNIPLDDGIDDHEYRDLFQVISDATIDRYQPNAIVLQCGADSLGGDRLGKFNLNIKAHGFCVEHIKSKGVPLMILGGGGYTPRNVARTWCHETALCINAPMTTADRKIEIPDYVPYRKAFEGAENGNGELYPALSNIPNRRHENKHTAARLTELKNMALQNLKYLEGCPNASDQFKDLPADTIRQLMDEYSRSKDEDEMVKETDRTEDVRRKKEKNIGGRLEYRFK